MVDLKSILKEKIIKDSLMRVPMFCHSSNEEKDLMLKSIYRSIDTYVEISKGEFTYLLEEELKDVLYKKLMSGRRKKYCDPIGESDDFYAVSDKARKIMKDYKDLIDML